MVAPDDHILHLHVHDIYGILVYAYGKYCIALYADMHINKTITTIWIYRYMDVWIYGNKYTMHILGRIGRWHDERFETRHGSVYTSN